ncbi:uncharacterized protein GLRG_02049 [Colletotrichum graminicola M1.001]|uniref:Uncharacterized protein n=1 Tax=Colletotrichum graminicola (strain M1.001 / M2 / FGSC 10212) TaxID=645133 RepID=E3Q8K7_COLGM|nr:uncharacterized protein GLRG_02049 [Colletotrichum graminicola M1.001]EFQ26878.1 hypothetical protein GLRG_02049 [Colletotrichum graminicola M1.001]
MSQPAGPSLRSKGKAIAKPDTQPPKDQSTPGRSAYGVPTINVLSTAISRGKPPTDLQTRSDFCFDRLLSFLPHDEHKLLRVYRALDVPSARLRKWASKGRKRLGQKVLARLEQQKDAAPGEYQFAVDHPYVWGLGNGDAWARAGQAYDLKLKGEPLRLPDKEAVMQEDIPGGAVNGASSPRPNKTSKYSRKRNRNALDDTNKVPGAHGRHTEFQKKKAAGIGPSPLRKSSSR